jgi:hypothetical protein
VLNYYKMLKNPSVSIEDFWKSSSALYKFLIPSGSEEYIEIIIIPDGVLYFLPFGTLIDNSTAKSSWESLPYMELSHTISYDFSLQTMTQANAYDYSSSYDASYIYMADKKVYVDEIMTLPLQTELCLLTACEVGLGKSYSGEGVTGVAWAFRAAGAQNVVQSLWRINQESSANVMNSFFALLADKNLSTIALQNAKLEYLNNENISERLKHPYYWAGMIHYGSGMTSEATKWSVWQILLLCGVLSLGPVIYLLAKRKLKH